MSDQQRGWIGVDLDQTLAKFSPDHWVEITDIGEPIQPMVDVVKHWLAEGHEVRIMTARAQPVEGVRTPEDVERFRVALRAWTLKHIGTALEATATKDFQMALLYDDRARQVEANTGRIVVDGGVPCPVCEAESVARGSQGTVRWLHCFACGTDFWPASK